MMSVLLNINPNQVSNIYNSITLYNRKGKMDMILEPLQSMIQLSLLSVTPIGTKLTIHDNILSLQTPSLYQPLHRWIFSDKKEDLLFLFQVIKRFIKWYRNPPNKIISIELYQLIIKMSLEGLENLSKTYATNENSKSSSPVIEVLQIYKTILKNQELLNENDNALFDDENDDKYNIDTVFMNITEIYDENIIQIINNSLVLINKNDKNINYVNGVNLLLSDVNDKIKSWIGKHLLLL